MAQQPRGYVDVRSDNDLEKKCQEFIKQGVADKIAVVSLGDEIGLPAPPATDHEGFRRLQALRIVYYKLQKLEQQLHACSRSLNDLRSLRRLLLEEREIIEKKAV